MDKSRKIKLACIVIIDDDDISNYLLVRLLKKLDICDNIRLFRNGREGLSFIYQNFMNKFPFPDVIFLDMNMPVVNGVEFLEKLNGMNIGHNQIKIIPISNVMNESSKEQLRKLNIHRYMIKPFSAEEVTLLINN
jgi:two-component SAPR family response regulator